MPPQVKATLLQLEGLEGGLEERLRAPAAPCLSCADWFLPAAPPPSSSSSPVLSKLAEAMRGSSSAGARGRGLFGDRARRPSPRRNPSDSGNDGPPQDSGAGVSPDPTRRLGVSPDPGRRLGARHDSLESGGSDGSGSLFKVRAAILLCLFFV